MIAYAREFGLTVEDVGKQPGEVFYYFDGVRVPEATVVEEFRAFAPAMSKDLRTISAEPIADNHTPADVGLDLTSLRQYLETRQAGRIAAKAIEEAYVAEYGREIDEQSCLNFLLFIHADRRSKFTPFGVYSDERYHIVEGNDAIATGLAGRLAGQIRYGKRLAAVSKLPTGRIRLTLFGPHDCGSRRGGSHASLHRPTIGGVPRHRYAACQTLRDRQARLWRQCEADGRLRQAVLARVRQQRRFLF
jgi:monoamine oxidase